MLEYLETFNSTQTIVMLVCKQISFDAFKHKTIDLQIMYSHLTVC